MVKWVPSVTGLLMGLLPDGWISMAGTTVHSFKRLATLPDHVCPIAVYKLRRTCACRDLNLTFSATLETIRASNIHNRYAVLDPEHEGFGFYTATKFACDVNAKTSSQVLKVASHGAIRNSVQRSLGFPCEPGSSSKGNRYS